MFTYRWTHVPTGKTGLNTFAGLPAPDFPHTRAQALAIINRWNAQQTGIWVYVLE